MASNEEGEETAPRGNEWEVVSLTQSAYAASPGPKEVDANDDNVTAEYVAETSQAMFMSGHFLFPPNQHENLPLDSDNEQGGEDATPEFVPDNEQGGKDTTPEYVPDNEEEGEDAIPEFVADKGGKSDIYEGSTKAKELCSPEFPGMQFFDEKGNGLSISGAEFEEDTALQGLSLVDKEQTFLGTAKYSSFQSEEPLSRSAPTEGSDVLPEPVESFNQGLDSPKATEEDDYDADNLPCQAWWKRRAASLIAHAKDANAFWSIFVAAAVMGLVIIGQRWQQEKWLALQMKWQTGVHDERMGRMFGPLSRLKDVIVGGDRRGAFIRGSTPSQP